MPAAATPPPKTVLKEKRPTSHISIGQTAPFGSNLLENSFGYACSVPFSVRPARTSDVPAIKTLVEPLVQRRILLGKERVLFYEAVQEFRVAVDDDGPLIGCGALHVMWEDLGEVRTLAVADDWLHHGV